MSLHKKLINVFFVKTNYSSTISCINFLALIHCSKWESCDRLPHTCSQAALSFIGSLRNKNWNLISSLFDSLLLFSAITSFKQVLPGLVLVSTTGPNQDQSFHKNAHPIQYRQIHFFHWLWIRQFADWSAWNRGFHTDAWLHAVPLRRGMHDTCRPSGNQRKCTQFKCVTSII